MNLKEKLLARHTQLLKQAFFALKKSHSLSAQSDALCTKAYKNLIKACAIEAQLKKEPTP